MPKAKGKKAFGGYAINFKGVKTTIEEVMGSEPIGPAEMTKRLWKLVKERSLGGRQ